MPQLSPVTLNGYTTDAHVFAPIDIVNGVSALGENLALGANILKQSILPKGQGTEAKRSIRLPLVRTGTDGIPYVAGTINVIIQYNYPNIATEEERQLAVGLAKNASGETAWMTSVVDRQNYY